ncbi:MAG: hypothetical protein LBF22_15570 [Deltaproteobacteria bacterium]|nr:hypothetical protein [Deltaproteobacteria bacterium]
MRRHFSLLRIRAFGGLSIAVRLPGLGIVKVEEFSLRGFNPGIYHGGVPWVIIFGEIIFRFFDLSLYLIVSGDSQKILK